MPFENEHSARLKSPNMDHVRVRRTKGSGDGTVQGVKVPKTISVIWFIVRSDGEEHPVAQALRFPTKDWTASEARAWLKDKEIKFILFEKAEESEGKKGEMSMSKKLVTTAGKETELPGQETQEGSKDLIGKAHIPEVDKNARRMSTLKDGAGLVAKARLGKAKKGDPGFVQGYAAIWDNIDLGGEIMRKGAFAKSLKERVEAGKVKLMVKHFAFGGDVLDCIGTITEAKEDDTGLWFDAKFSSVEVAQNVRTLILEGHVETCSVGYMPVKWNWLNVDIEGESGSKSVQVLEHIECKFYEVTITVIPMNEKAELTAAKSLDLASSKIKDIVGKLSAEGDEALSGDEKAAFITNVLGGEDDTAGICKSLRELADQLDRLIDVKNEPENTASKSAADLRQMNLDMKKRRLALVTLATD